MVWQGWLVTCSPLPTSSFPGHWLPFNETRWPDRSKGNTLCGSPAPGITPDSSSSEGAKEGRVSLEKGYLSTEMCSCPIMNWRLSTTTWVMSYM